MKKKKKKNETKKNYENPRNIEIWIEKQKSYTIWLFASRVFL